MSSAVARCLAFAARAIPILLRDLTGLSGAGLIAYGAWMIYAPAGFIVGGSLLLCGAMLLSKSQG